MLKWLIAVIVLYAGFVALLYVAQRSLQYFPERRRTAPRAIGLPEAEEAVLDTTDGERVIVWHVPPREGRPVFLYFHGNGGSLRWRDERFRALITDGSGLVALSYRGYGGSSGRPTESGLVEDAAAAYRAPWGLSLLPQLDSCTRRLGHRGMLAARSSLTISDTKRCSTAAMRIAR